MIYFMIVRWLILMHKEFKILIYSMINNFAIAVIKVVGGFSFQLGSLFADGLHTFSDFITDILCFIGAKIAKKKPTKYHPFGFGRVEYLINLFVGILLLLLGFCIMILGFFKEIEVPPVSVLWLLVVVFGLKLIAIVVMHRVGKRLNSQLLITSVKESKTDLYSTILVFIISILLQFSKEFPIFSYADFLGSFIIAVIVLRTAVTIMIDNSLSLIGEVEDDTEAIAKVENFVAQLPHVKAQRVSLIKYGSYYKLQLLLELDPKLTLRQITNLEHKIKTDIVRHRSLRVKYVTIYVTNQLKKEI